MPIEPRFARRGLPALAIGLVALALAAPAALAQSTELRSQAPTSSLAGTTHANTPADVTPARAQEDYYSFYGNPAPPSSARAVNVDAGDGIAPLVFVLAVLGALIVGIGATSGVHVLAGRRRARLA